MRLVYKELCHFHVCFCDVGKIIQCMQACVCILHLEEAWHMPEGGARPRIGSLCQGKPQWPIPGGMPGKPSAFCWTTAFRWPWHTDKYKISLRTLHSVFILKHLQIYLFILQKISSVMLKFTVLAFVFVSITFSKLDTKKAWEQLASNAKTNVYYLSYHLLLA